eukprot:TRINITY_DN12114_c0_g3_i5.p2 TRINITY_DN12114_c0_g3~~TRINITY_DN12114_c0_g3_i5.p2  ORF type:complete len:108 (-),score=3.44 TRINITY_DN12114_c0_g3_i5:77-400(-)
MANIDKEDTRSLKFLDVEIRHHEKVEKESKNFIDLNRQRIALMYGGVVISQNKDHSSRSPSPGRGSGGHARSTSIKQRETLSNQVERFLHLAVSQFSHTYRESSILR